MLTRRLCKFRLNGLFLRGYPPPSTGFTHPLNSCSLYGFVCGRLQFGYLRDSLQSLFLSKVAEGAIDQ